MSRSNNTSQRIRVGLMGFGRIGRNFYRLASENTNVEIPIISDLGQPEILHYLLQRDTVHGPFQQEARLENNRLQLDDGRTSEMIIGVAPGDVPWNRYDVDVVVDATGKYLKKVNMEAHLAVGAKRVIIANLPDEEIDRLVVMGVNDDTISPSDRMISACSSTTSPVALMLKVIDDKFGVERAMMTTIHAYTSDQPLADTAGSDFRRSRSAAESIIPNETPTAKWLEVILPQFKGRFDGIALNVPVPDGSCIDITYQFKDAKATVEAINEAMLDAAGEMPDIIEVTEDPVVSSDVIGNRHSLVFDSKATMKTKGNLVKTISWYDNGWGHAARVLDIIQAYAQFKKKEGVS